MIDVKIRGCYYNVDEDKDLDKVMIEVLVGIEVDFVEFLFGRLVSFSVRDNRG